MNWVCHILPSGMWSLKLGGKKLRLVETSVPRELCPHGADYTLFQTAGLASLAASLLVPTQDSSQGPGQFQSVSRVGLADTFVETALLLDFSYCPLLLLPSLALPMGINCRAQHNKLQLTSLHLRVFPKGPTG